MWTFESCVVVVLCVSLPFATDADAKAAKRNYNLEVEGFEVVRNPAFLVQIKQLRLSKYNSTTTVIHGKFTYTEDLPLDIMFHLTAYQLMGSNKYSMIPVSMPVYRVCEVIEKDTLYYPRFLANSNFPKKCPGRKGEYWLKDFTPEFKELPAELPGERWKLVWKLTSKKRTLAQVVIYMYINRNI